MNRRQPISKSTYFIAIIALLLYFKSVASFPSASVLVRPTNRRNAFSWKNSPVSFLAASPEESEDNDEEICHDDVEVDPAFLSQDDVPLPVAPQFLTASEKSIRQAELDLLAELIKDDAPIHKLRLLWYGERGPEVEERLRRAWQGLGHPDYWQGAEKTLRAVIQQEGPTYLFPFVLLSKLYFFQEKFEESQRICERIYEIKPYHFSIMENMVANCVALGKAEEAEQWQQKRLPTPDKKKQREAWVKKAIDDALRVLEETKQQQSELLPKTETENEGIMEGIQENLSDGNGHLPDPWQ